MARLSGNAVRVAPSRQLQRLQSEYGKLQQQMRGIEKQMAKFDALHRQKPVFTASKLGRWLDEISQGLENLPPLPADFSRADIYDDHD